MLGAAAVMAMAVSSGKAGNTGSETTAETASASVSETVETAPAAETATNAVNLKADGFSVGCGIGCAPLAGSAHKHQQGSGAERKITGTHGITVLQAVRPRNKDLRSEL